MKRDALDLYDEIGRNVRSGPKLGPLEDGPLDPVSRQPGLLPLGGMDPSSEADPDLDPLLALLLSSVPGLTFH